MVRCPDCETPNSVDSKFCKFCGASLPEEDRVDAQLKLNELIAEGYKMFNEGRTEEAALIAESALTSAPEKAQALSLKGMCLERDGRLAEALEIYERVVELNPDSPLDKIKVAHVRNRLAAKVAEVPQSNRRLAIVGACAAGVLVMAVGAIIATAASGSTKTAANKSNAQSDSSQIAGFDQSQIQTNQVPPNGNTDATAAGRSDDKPAASPTQEPGGTSRLTPVLPGLEGSLAGGPGSPVVSDPAKQGPKIVDSPNGGDVTKKGPVVDPAPAPTDLPVEPKRDVGQYEITVVRGKQTASGGTQSADDPNQLRALIKTGRDQYILGNYQAAAGTFERALRAGGDPATINERIGQCYGNLNRKGEAINAYTKAIDAFQTQLSRHDSPALRSGLQTCKQALKVLQG